MTREMGLISYLNGSNIAFELHREYVVNNDLGYWEEENWPHDGCDILLILQKRSDVTIKHAFRKKAHESVFFFIGGTACEVTVSDGDLIANCASKSHQALRGTMQTLRQIFPPPQRDRLSKEIPMYFWVHTSTGPRKMRRSITVPSWEAVRENYPSGIQQSLDTLTRQRPDSGKIILWHGPPGTGKSFALRALAWEWADWLDVHYVIDPEVMFGTDSNYLVNLLFDDDGAPVSLIGGEERWRLIVMEDTGEMLRADAKEHVGQALSRLLNMSDGLLGQGSKVLTLITTNEPLGRMHPAITRPGRCASEIEFGPLSGKESLKWLLDHDVHPAFAEGSMTLAELYALAEGKTIKQVEPVGFRLG